MSSLVTLSSHLPQHACLATTACGTKSSVATINKLPLQGSLTHSTSQTEVRKASGSGQNYNHLQDATLALAKLSKNETSQNNQCDCFGLSPPVWWLNPSYYRGNQPSCRPRCCLIFVPTHHSRSRGSSRWEATDLTGFCISVKGPYSDFVRKFFCPQTPRANAYRQATCAPVHFRRRFKILPSSRDPLLRPFRRAT